MGEGQLFYVQFSIFSPSSSSISITSSMRPTTSLLFFGYCEFTQVLTSSGAYRNCSSTNSSRICFLVWISGLSHWRLSFQSWLRLHAGSRHFQILEMPESLTRVPHSHLSPRLGWFRCQDVSALRTSLVHEEPGYEVLRQSSACSKLHPPPQNSHCCSNLSYQKISIILRLGLALVYNVHMQWEKFQEFRHTANIQVTEKLKKKKKKKDKWDLGHKVFPYNNYKFSFVRIRYEPVSNVQQGGLRLNSTFKTYKSTTHHIWPQLLRRLLDRKQCLLAEDWGTGIFLQWSSHRV